MTDVKIDVPSLPASYYDVVSAKANKEKIVNVIRPKFGKYIKVASVICGVPAELIEGFIFIESGGNPNASSPYAVGLMQVGFATASDSLVREKGAGRLSPAEASIIKKYLGSRYSLLEKVKPNQKTIGKTFITKQDLLNPEFNITVGCILLKQLIDEFTEKSGKVRMDKVIAIYNSGRYGATAKKVIAYQGGVAQMVKEVPKETSDYIVKLLGKDGILDTLA